MNKYRSCVICSKQGNVLLYAGIPCENLGIASASKFCRVVVALKTLAPNQKIMMMEISGAKVAVLEHSCFLACILTHQCSPVEKHELILDALQIAHLFDIFYSEEIELIVHRERAVASAAAESYSVNTELNFLEQSDELNHPLLERKLFADFASNFVDKLLLREPLCSEWILPLLSADDVFGCSLVNNDGDEIFKLPARIGPDFGHFECDDLLMRSATIQLVVEKAMEVMKIMTDIEAESNESKAKVSPCHTELDGQLHTLRVANLGSRGPNSYHALLLPTSNGPMSMSLCLIVYYWFSTAESQFAEGSYTAVASHVAGTESLPMTHDVDDYSRPPGLSHEATTRGNRAVLGRLQEWNGAPAGSTLRIPVSSLADLLCVGTRAGMKEQSFRIACAALDCIAAAFPCRDTMPALLTSTRATPTQDAKPASARTLPFSSPSSAAAHSSRTRGVSHRAAPKPAPPPKPRASAAPSKARRNQVRSRDVRLRPAHGGHHHSDERRGGEGEGAAARGVGLELSAVAALEPSPGGLAREAPLRLEDLAARRPAAGPCGVPHGAESAREDRWAVGHGAGAAGQERAHVAPEQQGVVVSCPPQVDWQAAPPEAGRRGGAEHAGEEGLRREKQRRMALLGLVSPRIDDDVPPLPAAHGTALPPSGSGGAGGDESAYGLLPAVLQDTPRKGVGTADRDSAGGPDVHLRLDGPASWPDRRREPPGASLSSPRAALAPEAEAQAQDRHGCARRRHSVECGGGGIGPERHGSSCTCSAPAPSPEVQEWWSGGGGAVGRGGRDGTRARLRGADAQGTAAGPDRHVPAACGETHGQQGPHMDWEASGRAGAAALRASVRAAHDMGMRRDAALAPDAGLAGRIACLQLARLPGD
jgi:hypothetical protein